MAATKRIKNARQSARRAFEVEYIPESVKAPSPMDVIIQNLLLHRGKPFVLLTKGLKKASTAYSFVRRVRRRAEEGGVGLLIQVFTRSDWKGGLVTVYGRALTDEQHREVVAALDGKVSAQPANQLVKEAMRLHKLKEAAVIKEKQHERDRDEDRGGGEGEG